MLRGIYSCHCFWLQPDRFNPKRTRVNRSESERSPNYDFLDASNDIDDDVDSVRNSASQHDICR